MKGKATAVTQRRAPLGDENTAVSYLDLSAARVEGDDGEDVSAVGLDGAGRV